MRCGDFPARRLRGPQMAVSSSFFARANRLGTAFSVSCESRGFLRLGPGFLSLQAARAALLQEVQAAGPPLRMRALFERGKVSLAIAAHRCISRNVRATEWAGAH